MNSETNSETAPWSSVNALFQAADLVRGQFELQSVRFGHRDALGDQLQLETAREEIESGSHPERVQISLANLSENAPKLYIEGSPSRGVLISAEWTDREERSAMNAAIWRVVGALQDAAVEVEQAVQGRAEERERQIRASRPRRERIRDAVNTWVDANGGLVKVLPIGIAVIGIIVSATVILITH